MKAVLVCAVGLFALAGCKKASSDLVSGGHGRYEGVGVFSPGLLWSQMSGPATTDPMAAKLGDDEQVIVVQDTQTGEIRQCGNFSGYCIAMNPWAKPLTTHQNAPVALAKHATELDDATGAKAAKSESSR